MSVRTTADEKVDLAEENIRTAAMALANVVIDECYGYEEYSIEWKDSLRSVLNDLIMLKEKLLRH